MDSEKAISRLSSPPWRMVMLFPPGAIAVILPTAMALSGPLLLEAAFAIPKEIRKRSNVVFMEMMAGKELCKHGCDRFCFVAADVE